MAKSIRAESPWDGDRGCGASSQRYALPPLALPHGGCPRRASADLLCPPDSPTGDRARDGLHIAVATSPRRGMNSRERSPSARKIPARSPAPAMYDASRTAAGSRGFFARAIAADSGSYDAVVGAGLVAYRSGNMPMARRSFERALRIVPNDSTALAYLAQLAGEVAEDVLPTRPRPAKTTMVGRAGRRVLEVRNAAGQWSPMWIKAVNLGAALPGKFPSEFPPNDGTYERWIAIIADMGANTVRVYTIHPPHFYAALRSWNLAHPDRTVWLIHGVWAEPPPGKKEEKYDDPQWLARFRREMKRVVGIVHGNATIPPAPGHASGAYRADLSPWTLGYIIGRNGNRTWSSCTTRSTHGRPALTASTSLSPPGIRSRHGWLSSATTWCRSRWTGTTLSGRSPRPIGRRSIH